MDLNSKIEDAQRNLKALCSTLEDFGRGSKLTITQDQDVLYVELHKSINSVKTILPLVQGCDDSAMALVRTRYKPTIQEKSEQTLVRQHISTLRGQFQVLQVSAKTGLEHVQCIQKTGYDHEQKLSGNEARLNSLSQQSTLSLQNATRLLGEKRASFTKAKNNLSVQENRLKQVKKEIKSEKISTGVTSSLAAVATVGSVFFLPLLLVAGGLTGAAIATGQHTREAEQLHAKLQIPYRSLKLECEQLERQMKMYTATVSSTNGLLSQCRESVSEASQMRSQIDASLEIYQNIKEAADEFLAWTNELNDEMQSLNLLGRKNIHLTRGLKQILSKLVKNLDDQQKVKRICASL